ncbi:MAG: Ig domain-containing protein [Verrucomicrobia bacterium]|nr:Ig domain-containing protein [Verrucomicrobiota bacterium]
MKPILHKFRYTALIAVSFAASNFAIAAQDDAYTANDVLLFLQNPAGAVGNDKVVYHSLGSAASVATLNATFGADWSSKVSTIFTGAAGQQGSTSALSTAVSNGDFARTIYVTKPRASAGTAGQTNSSSPLFDPASTSVAGFINSSNSFIGMTQPGAVLLTEMQVDNYNPITNGNPALAYTAISSGIQGSISNSTFSLGSVTNIVAALDLYRVTKTSGTNAADSNTSLWHIANSKVATYSNNTYPGSNSARADYLGTITLSSDGSVNFVAQSPAVPLISSATSANGTVGTAFNYTISGSNSPTSFSSSILPAGLTLNSTTGVISGTPKVPGVATVTVTAQNPGGSDTKNLTITIAGRPIQDDAYTANDILLFFQNPAGTVGTDNVVYFSLGSAVSIFRDAQEGTITELGNINTTLNATFGSEWNAKASTIFAGAAGQQGATSALSTAVSNGDYARTVYVTKPRSSAGNSWFEFFYGDDSAWSGSDQ